MAHLSLKGFLRRPLSKRFFLIFGVVGIAIWGWLNRPSSQMVRATVLDVGAPVMSWLSRPVQSITVSLENFFASPHRIQTLQTENERLKRLCSEVESLRAENEVLRNLSHLPLSQPLPKAKVASIIRNSGGDFIIVEGGADRKFVTGMPVLNGEGLAGRLIEVGRAYSKGFLITDPRSRIPAINTRTHVQCILRGAGEDKLSIDYLEGSDIAIGDVFVTTHDGNIVPAHIPVGEVTEIRDGNPYVSPYVSFDTVAFVALCHPPAADVVTRDEDILA